MKLIHSNIDKEQEVKRVPLYKNRIAIEELVRKITRENNERVLKSRSN